MSEEGKYFEQLPEDMKNIFLNSVLEGSKNPLPPLLIDKDVDEQGNERYYIIDGQQRLDAIKQMFDNPEV